MTILEMMRLFISEAEQQPLVNIVMLLADFGLRMLLVILAIVMIRRFIDLLRIWVRNNATPTYFSPDVGFHCVRGGE